MVFTRYALAFLLLVSANVVAADDFESTAYVFADLGSLKTELSDYNFDNSYDSIGFGLGYQVTSYFGVEYYVAFAGDKKRDDYVSGLVGEDVYTEYDTSGMFLTLQSAGDFYVKGRLGYAESKFTYTAHGYYDLRRTEKGVAYGIGAGARFGHVELEASFLTLPEFTDPLFTSDSWKASQFKVSVGARF